MAQVDALERVGEISGGGDMGVDGKTRGAFSPLGLIDLAKSLKRDWDIKKGHKQIGLLTGKADVLANDIAESVVVFQQDVQCLLDHGYTLRNGRLIEDVERWVDNFHRDFWGVVFWQAGMEDDMYFTEVDYSENSGVTSLLPRKITSDPVNGVEVARIAEGFLEFCQKEIQRRMEMVFKAMEAPPREEKKQKVAWRGGTTSYGTDGWSA